MKPTTRIAATLGTLALLAAPALAQNAPAQKKTNPGASMQMGEAPTDVPRPKIFRRDENGRVVRINQIPDILALRANPTVGPRSVELIMPVYYGRRAKFELLLIDNLDLFWHVTDGRLNNLDFKNIKELAQLAQMVNPMGSNDSFTDELQNRGILTRTQAAMNRHIVQEYRAAVQNEIQVNAEDPLAALMTLSIKDHLQEISIAYRELLAEMMTQADEVVEDAGVDSEQAAVIASMASALSDDPRERVEQFLKFDTEFRKLEIDNAMALLEATRDRREHPNLSPMIREINVLHPGKSVATDSNMFEGAKFTQADGTEVKVKERQDEYDKVHEEKKKEFMEEAMNVGNDRKKKSADD